MTYDGRNKGGTELFSRFKQHVISLHCHTGDVRDASC